MHAKRKVSPQARDFRYQTSRRISSPYNAVKSGEYLLYKESYMNLRTSDSFCLMLQADWGQCKKVAYLCMHDKQKSLLQMTDLGTRIQKGGKVPVLVSKIQADSLRVQFQLQKLQVEPTIKYNQSQGFSSSTKKITCIYVLAPNFGADCTLLKILSWKSLFSY